MSLSILKVEAGFPPPTIADSKIGRLTPDKAAIISPAPGVVASGGDRASVLGARPSVCTSYCSTLRQPSRLQALRPSPKYGKEFRERPPQAARPRTACAGVRRAPLPASPTQRTLDRARRRLLGLQRPDGHWCGELQGDTILESEYVLLMAFMGRENEERTRKAAEYVLRQQRPTAAGRIILADRWN